MELGRPRLARRQLELAAAARHRGPVQVRTRAWHAAALVRLSRGDRRGAGAAISAGLRALEAHRTTLGATELRAHASGHGEELATLGLRLAVESGSAARVLAAAERRRAAGLLQRPARPPDDEELAADLMELRRVTAALDESLREGRPDTDLVRRQAALERSVRRRALRARGERAAAGGAGAEQGGARAAGGGGAAVEERVPSLAALSAVLGERVLVDFAALDGRLLAVTVVGRRARLHSLGSAADIEREVASLRMSLRSLATAPPGSRAADAMAGICDAVAAKLDALLFGPLELADRPLVLVPTGALHALPWSMLPSLRAPAARRRAVAAALVPRGERSTAVHHAAGARRGPAAPGGDGGDRDAPRPPPGSADADRRSSHDPERRPGAGRRRLGPRRRTRQVPRRQSAVHEPRARRRDRDRLQPRAAAAASRAGSCSRAASPACPRSRPATS